MLNQRELQAICCCIRIGQTKNVPYFRETLDTKILELQVTKLQMSMSTLQERVLDLMYDKQRFQGSEEMLAELVSWINLQDLDVEHIAPLKIKWKTTKKNLRYQNFIVAMRKTMAEDVFSNQSKYRKQKHQKQDSDELNEEEKDIQLLHRSTKQSNSQMYHYRTNSEPKEKN